MSSLTRESKRHRTPNGGVASTIYYQDENGQPADKSMAVKCEIVELDRENRVIHRTYARLDGGKGISESTDQQE